MLFIYLFWQSLVCYVIPDVITLLTALFANMVFSDEDKILIKICISWRDIMRDSWGQNFRAKDGRQVALTGCWRSSETWAQWTDVRVATDGEVSTQMKTLTRWMMWFWVNRTSPKLTAQSVKYHGRQAFLSCLLSASYERICSWNALKVTCNGFSQNWWKSSF